ncbi:MAG: DUF445 family protein [Clostridia bacterium]|nr:DUF445 family protein [Clostridia bacterium]
MTDLIRYLSGPLIGSVIGYFTNYIAVKMLFRPHREIKLFGVRLPFTPGLIPKRQGDMAKAVGNAISRNLFTSSDLSKTFFSEENMRKVSEKIIALTDSEKSIAEIIESVSAESDASVISAKAANVITDKLIDAAEKMNAGKVLTDIAADTIEEKKQSLGMFAFIINDGILNSLLESFERKINKYIAEKGHEKLYPPIEDMVFEYCRKPICELSAKTDKEKAVDMLNDILKRALPPVFEKLLSDIDIAGTVESKINAMNVSELEELCLSVMKKELNAIVNLGALIGFIIGIVNSFI